MRNEDFVSMPYYLFFLKPVSIKLYSSIYSNDTYEDNIVAFFDDHPSLTHSELFEALDDLKNNKFIDYETFINKDILSIRYAVLEIEESYNYFNN